MAKEIYDRFTDEYIDIKDIDPIAPPERYEIVTEEVIIRNAARWLAEKLIEANRNKKR